MPNNDLNKHSITGAMLKASLLTLLLFQVSFAQAPDEARPTDSALPGTQNKQDSPPQQSNAGTEKNIKPSAKRPPATRFTPTEKLRADDAVAFPVDI